jgi:hypothetical protein
MQYTGNRCAEGRFPRSPSTVKAEVKWSHRVQLNALMMRSRLADTAPIIAAPAAHPTLLTAVYQHEHTPASYLGTTNIPSAFPYHPDPHTSSSVVPLPSSRTIQIQHTTAVRRGASWTAAYHLQLTVAAGGSQAGR